MLRGLLIAFVCVASFVATNVSALGASRFSGAASFYGEESAGPVASGGTYRPEKLTCAHRTLPFGTRLRVTDRKTHRSVSVTVNDRGPFVNGRVLDLSLAAARSLRMTDRGVIDVSAVVQSLGRKPAVVAH
jgi:rare lipoprotein A